VSKKFFVVSEARADFITATELADRVLLTEIAWLDEHLIEFQREWVGEVSPGCHLAWATVSHRAREVGIRAQGHFNGEPGLPDARAARRAILYVLHQFSGVNGILLIRDLDNQHERKLGLEQARNDDKSGMLIIIGVAGCKRECWVICGFEPEDENETQLLAVERQNLGTNPCIRSHELTASSSDIALRSPKRVLKVLTGDNWERQRRCWMVTPLNVLKDRGEDNGLASYLDEIKLLLAPIIAGGKGWP
jgi:hypothetical protein